MSTNQDPSGAPIVTASGEQTDDQKPVVSSGDDKISYESHQKALHEKRKALAKVEAYETELQKLREEKLGTEGKKDELISEYKKKYDELQGKFKGSVGKFAMKTLTDSIEKEALKAGCLNPKSLSKLVDVAEIDVNEDFEVNQEQLKKAIEAVKSENPFMFAKSAPGYVDVTKTVTEVKSNGSLKGKSVDELSRMLATLNNQPKN